MGEEDKSKPGRIIGITTAVKVSSTDRKYFCIKICEKRTTYEHHETDKMSLDSIHVRDDDCPYIICKCARACRGTCLLSDVIIERQFALTLSLQPMKLWVCLYSTGEKYETHLQNLVLRTSRSSFRTVFCDRDAIEPRLLARKPYEGDENSAREEAADRAAQKRAAGAVV